MKVQQFHTLGKNREGARPVGHQPCTWLHASFPLTEHDGELSREQGRLNICHTTAHKHLQAKIVQKKKPTKMNLSIGLVN